jgi:hypothetical protein
MYREDMVRKVEQGTYPIAQTFLALRLEFGPRH